MKRGFLILTVAAALVASGAFAADKNTNAQDSVAKDSGAKDSAAKDSAAKDRDADIEAKLEAARQRLEEAAHEVAELSAQIGKPLMEHLEMLGEGPRRAIIGVQLDPESGKDGARVREVSPGGPAAEAGIRAGDVIVAVNGTEVKGDDAARQVAHLVRDVEPNAKVKVRVRRDNRPQEFVVNARPLMHYQFFSQGVPFLPPDIAWQGPPPGINATYIARGGLGDLQLATLTPQLGRYFGSEKGVLVVRAPSEGGFKLEDGDVILAIDGREPTSGAHATRILASYQPGEKITLRLMRAHKAINIDATIPETPARVRKEVRFLRKGEEPT